MTNTTLRPVANVVVESVSMVTMCVMSLVLNILVCVVIRHSRRLQSTTNYFVVSLAGSDLCLTICCMPFVVTRVIAGTWITGVAMCKIVR